MFMFIRLYPAVNLRSKLHLIHISSQETKSLIRNGTYTYTTAMSIFFEPSPSVILNAKAPLLSSLPPYAPIVQ